jgi:hypothetical protein
MTPEGKVATLRNAQLLCGAVGIVAIVASWSSVTSAEPRYTYRVEHSIYGEIGSYSNDVEVSGNATTIATEADIRISVLGAILYRQQASRVERWTGAML